MAITKQSLEKMRAELQQQHTQTNANLQAISGAIQLCDQLIADVNLPEPASPVQGPE